MEMHQVRYSLAVARNLNFTRAAEECNVAQPSLTRAVKQLEAELGGDLFCRERNLTHLTEFGQRMLPFLQQCYDSAQAAKELAQSIKSGAVAPLSIALSSAINIELFVPHLNELTRAVKGVELRFIRGPRDDVIEQMKKGEAEVAIAGRAENNWDRLDSWPLFTEGFRVAVKEDNPLAGKETVVPQDFNGQRIMIRTYCEFADLFSSFLTEQGIKPLASHRIVTEADYVAMIENGLAIGMLPESSPESARMVRRPLEGLSLMRTVHLYAVAGRQRSPAASLFIKLLRAADWSPYTSRSESASDDMAADRIAI